MAIYKILADLVVFVHGAYVSFVVFGFLLILVGAFRRWQWVRGFVFRVAHLAAIAIVCGEAMLQIECPLTTLENYFRREGGQSGYAADFVGHWVHELIFFDAPPWVFTVAYIAFGLIVLATFVFAPPRLPWRRPRV
jgi:hypothetical protein